MSPWWSYVLTALGVAGIFLAGSRKRIGWALGLSVQPLWIIYALATDQWGFILSGVVYGGVYLRNWLRWRRDAQSPAAVKMTAPPWRTHREEVQYAQGRARGGESPRWGQQVLGSADVPVVRGRPQLPSAMPAALNPDRCRPQSGYHSTPHRGCILR